MMMQKDSAVGSAKVMRRGRAVAWISARFVLLLLAQTALLDLAGSVTLKMAGSGFLPMAGSDFLPMAGSAWAGEPYCVTCTAPHKVYQCQVDSGTGAPSVGALQLYCIQQLAKSGGHDSCSVKRRGAVTCSGLPTTLLYRRPATPGQPPGAMHPPASAMNEPAMQPGEIRTPSRRRAAPRPADPKINSPSQSAAGPPASSQSDPAAGPTRLDRAKPPEQSKQPATVEELAKKTGRVVTDAAKKAGKGVAGAAKKTWNCVTTLFSNC